MLLKNVFQKEIAYSAILKNVFQKEPQQPNYLDLNLNEQAMIAIEFARAQAEARNEIVTFEGYRVSMKGLQHICPLIISQTKEQTAKLEAGSLEGTLHVVTGDTKKRVMGEMHNNALFFTPTEASLFIAMFSSQVSENVLEPKAEYTTLKEIYDAVLIEGIYRGNWYTPPRMPRSSSNYLAPSSLGMFCLKRTQ
jgi:hypothetical protein